MRFFLCLSLALTPALAETWTGALVDSKCYDNLESNRSPKETLFYVDRDRGSEIRYCYPKASTKLYAIVQIDGIAVKLDPSANAKASDLVQKAAPGTKWFQVSVSGEMSKKFVNVDSITLAK